LKAMAKRPQDRYASAGLLGADLQAWLEGKPTAVNIAAPRKRQSPKFVVASILCIGFAIAFMRPKTSPPPAVVALPTVDNSLGERLVLIPAGQFMFGSPTSENGRDRSEQLRLISIHDPFYISAIEVTQAQYEKVMHDNPSDPRSRGPSLPVENLSWYQARDFCDRLSQLEHHSYRLPREREWEYACRANSTNAFTNGLEPKAVGWFAENSGGHVKPTAIKSPNAWGLFDMHGNVAEWCSDLDVDDGDRGGAQSIATTLRAIRGGSVLSQLLSSRSAARRRASMDDHFSDVGFRVVREP
jgi:formylglycine-generating enzyme required for sulfatase activity